MKLHLGCGKRYFPGWTNLDIDNNNADIKDDATTLGSIANKSCDIIYASHLLEHFDRHQVLPILKTWYKKLKPGGILRLSVPDFHKLTIMYARGTKLETMLSYIIGGQKDKFDYHDMMFDKPTLTKFLKKAGFKKIKEWDWRKTDHSHHDDLSQAYLPHMDKEKGMMMSLNLQAVR